MGFSAGAPRAAMATQADLPPVAIFATSRPAFVKVSRSRLACLRQIADKTVTRAVRNGSRRATTFVTAQAKRVMPIHSLVSSMAGLLAMLLLPGVLLAQQAPPEYDDVYPHASGPGRNSYPAETASVGQLAQVDVRPIATLLAPVDFSRYLSAAKPPSGFYFSYDRIFISTSPGATVGVASSSGAEQRQVHVGAPMPITSPIASPNEAGAHVAGGNSYVSTIGPLGSTLSSGNRWEFGSTGTDTTGWAVSILDNVNSHQTAFDVAPQAASGSHGTR